MLILRKSAARGETKTDWLQSYHTFSFADYHDLANMQFGALRVINEDVVAPAKGFGMHEHRNMEIITYMVAGELSHHDSMGNGSIIRPGEIQRMSAGTGVRHSEFNHSIQQPVHLLQIWIFPEIKSLPPSYEQITINKKLNELILIGSNHNHDAAVKIHQDVNLYAGYFEEGKAVTYEFNDNRQGWLQLITGQLSVNDVQLNAGDGLAVSAEPNVNIHCQQSAEFLLFDLAQQ